MNITDNQRNKLFWLLQFLGWGSLNIISVLLIDGLSPQFILYSVVVGMFIGIIPTSGLRWYINKYVSFERFSFKGILKIGAATLVAVILFGSLNFAFGYFYGKYGPDTSEVELKMIKAFNKYWLLIFSSVFNIVLWLGCYLAVKLLLKANVSRIERLKLSDNLKQAQLNTLKGQINPHFMFNSLNNIRGLMLEDVDKSREMLTKLSEMLRYSLTKNSIDGIALEEELEMVENYIALSKIQFEERLQFKSEIAPDTLKLQIPPMIIQLLVENGAKHGISNIKTGGIIELKTSKLGEELHIEVNNTGKLQISKNSTQLGLKNIKQRLQLLYGEKASFKIKEEDNTVSATIKIPLQ